MRKIKIGVGQINSKDSKEEALGIIEAMTADLAGQGAKLVIFPEYSTFLSDTGNKEAAEPLDGPIITKFRELAKRHQIYFHNGSYTELDAKREKPFNTSVFINPQGEIEAVYRKIHMFDIEIPGKVSFKESDEVSPGDKLVVLKNAIAEFGFTICYDMRFPELFRKLTLLGAKIIFMPAAFTLYTGKDHWETILRARAIENQVYIVAPNQFGAHPPEGKMSYGNSMVIDPWGTVIARAQERECCFTAEIDMNFLDSVRTNLPSLKNRVDIQGLKTES